ncbi:uncharacterized protein B0H18DRAFT_1103400 [Fomitopsis serialis]|uniref:uncharacterized protein n=1 Tax=Fomitopsis serialis TaxID=139415 RepID=UPI00200785C7|nr:uncharacterized protein B0H18DRAFT_1103400 [Neoantrodia serialis]KAH9929325.1 hypothetical protein B0H18DRAFT_1103400 [Neoantrodia serialis]
MSSLSSFFSSFLPVAHADAPPPEVEAHKEEATPDEPEEGAEEGGEAEAEEEEEEPEDILPALREECEESAKCKSATEHFRHCEERVSSGNGHKHEDCIEEFCAYVVILFGLPADLPRTPVFRMMHCVDGCVAPKLFAKLK